MNGAVHVGGRVDGGRDVDEDGNTHAQDDGGYVSDENDEDSDDNDDDSTNDNVTESDSGRDSGNSNSNDDSSELRTFSVDEEIQEYDKKYIESNPNPRLEKVVASHEHLRHWQNYEESDGHGPRTSHSFQWQDAHLPRHSVAFQEPADRHSYHVTTTPDRNSRHSESPNYSNTPRKSLLQMAESPEDSGTQLTRKPSPAKLEIMRMLHDTHDPTLEGIRHSKQHH